MILGECRFTPTNLQPPGAICVSRTEPRLSFTVRRLDRRSHVCRAASVDAGCEKPKYHRAPDGRKPRFCHAPDGASRGEPRRRADRMPHCPPASGNRLQARQDNGRLGRCPMCEECNRRCSGGRPQHGVTIETQPRLARRRKFNGLTDAAKDVATGDTAGVAFVDRRPKSGKLLLRTAVRRAPASAARRAPPHWHFRSARS